MSRSTARRLRRETVRVDVSAEREAKAIERVHALAPRRKDARVTSSIHFAPKKPNGTKGWLVMTGPRRLASAPIRNASHRTPKLVNSYIRLFPVAT